MKHIKPIYLFESSTGLTKEQVEFLNKFTGGSWTLDPSTNFVDIDGDFICTYGDIKNFKGIKFGIIKGSFYCNSNKLTSLEGGPQEVGGSFSCSSNNLTSLQGGPQEVGGSFYCNSNKLTSLEGAPQRVRRDFYCNSNNLTSLQGGPQEVGGSFYCNSNNLTSLLGFPLDFEGFFSIDQTGGIHNWSIEWALKNIDQYKILSTLFTPEDIENLISDNTSKAIIQLKGIWSTLKKNPEYSHIEFPDVYKEDIELLSDLSDLGF